MNKHLKKIGKELKSLVSLLKIPILMASIFIELAIFLPYFITLIAQHSALGIIGLIASQSPIIYYMVREAVRKCNMLPRSEAWETPSQGAEQALEEYVAMLKKQRCKRH
jgi:hypothetical protein